MHKAIALGFDNKALTIVNNAEESFSLVVQEQTCMHFRWWVIDSTEYVIENEKECLEFLEHLKNNGIDPNAKIWFPIQMYKGE